MLVAIIEVLDSTIVNVSLPHMMSSLGANAEQITWVLTSYVVSSAVAMPLTGLMVERVGQRMLLIIVISGFLIASMLSGMTISLWQMVSCRIMQGIFGAGLVPLSQYILRDIYSQDEQGKAMAIWGIGIMVAPVLGPTLGGYITEYASWRWIFYINVPVCLISLLLTFIYIPETERNKRYIDWLGLILMGAGVACLQVFLDRGNQSSWFDSNFITLLCLGAISLLIIFIYRALHKQNNIIHIRLFKNRNFALCTIMLAIYAGAMFSALVLQPIMLEHLMNYPVSLTGLVMAPRGIASAIGMMLAPTLMKRVNAKALLLLGLFMSAYGTLLMANYNLYVDIAHIVWPSIIQGFGMGLFFVPISVYAFTTLPKDATAESSGLFSFFRMLGASIGISVFSTITTRETQVNWNRLGGHISKLNPNLKLWLQAHHLTLHNPLAIQELGQELGKQASMLGFVDSYYAITIAFFLMLPFIFLIKMRNI